jgi:hypothetical protein
MVYHTLHGLANAVSEGDRPMTSIKGTFIVRLDVWDNHCFCTDLPVHIQLYIDNKSSFPVDGKLTLVKDTTGTRRCVVRVF